MPSPTETSPLSLPAPLPFCAALHFDVLTADIYLRFLSRRVLECIAKILFYFGQDQAVLRALWTCHGRHDSGEVQFQSVREQRIRSEEHTSELQSPCNLVCRHPPRPPLFPSPPLFRSAPLFISACSPPISI